MTNFSQWASLLANGGFLLDKKSKRHPIIDISFGKVANNCIIVSEVLLRALILDPSFRKNDHLSRESASDVTRRIDSNMTRTGFSHL